MFIYVQSRQVPELERSYRKDGLQKLLVAAHRHTSEDGKRRLVGPLIAPARAGHDGP